MGRRGVQQLTPEQWRGALEQQIREKEQQKEQQRRQRFGGGNDEGELQRRSQSAPQQEKGDGELIPSVLGLERAATTSASGIEMEVNNMADRRRRFQVQQSREDYFMGLQEQIEEKMRSAKEAQDQGKSRRRRMSRREDDADDTVARQESCDPESKSADEKENSMAYLALQDTTEDTKPVGLSNQCEAESFRAPVLKAEVTADPVAITKIMDFCEELKKQNEDVKRQLLEQHAVLASLHSTLAVEADAKTTVAGSRRRNSVGRGSVTKAQSKAKPGDSLVAPSFKKSQSEKSETKFAVALPVAPRPRPTRGETKIPLPRDGTPSSLRSAGTDVVKGLAPEDAAKPKSSMLRAEVKGESSTHLDNLLFDEKIVPPDSLIECSTKEEDSQICDTKASSSEACDCVKSQEPEVAMPKNQEEEGNPTSSAEGVCMKKFVEDAETSDHSLIQLERIDAECPMDSESKFVHDWESEAIGDKLLDSTSISILDGPSSLIPIDQSVSRLF